MQPVACAMRAVRVVKNCSGLPNGRPGGPISDANISIPVLFIKWAPVEIRLIAARTCVPKILHSEMVDHRVKAVHVVHIGVCQNKPENAFDAEVTGICDRIRVVVAHAETALLAYLLKGKRNTTAPVKVGRTQI